MGNISKALMRPFYVTHLDSAGWYHQMTCDDHTSHVPRLHNEQHLPIGKAKFLHDYTAVMTLTVAIVPKTVSDKLYAVFCPMHQRKIQTVQTKGAPAALVQLRQDDWPKTCNSPAAFTVRIVSNAHRKNL